MAVEIQNYGEGVDSRYDAENPATYYSSSIYRKLVEHPISFGTRTIWIVERTQNSSPLEVGRYELRGAVGQTAERIRISRT